MSVTQVWRLTVAGRTHRVEADPGFTRRLRWYVDDELVAERKSTDEKVRLEAGADRLEVRFSTLGHPRRATLLDDADGIDLVPDADSPAAAHEEKVRAHPDRYAAIQTVVGVAKVVVPLVLALLLARLTLPHLRFDLDVPSPDLPSLPSLPLPDLPDLPHVTLPGPVRWVLENSKYVWPIVLAFVLARAEVRRRRRQDEKRVAAPEDDSAT